MPSRKPPPSVPPLPATTVPLSKPPTDALTTRLGDGLQAQLLEMIQGLQLFAEQRPSDEKATWGGEIGRLQSLLGLLHKTCPKETDSASDAPDAEGTLDPARLQEFGQLLTRLRGKKLSCLKVAQLAGLSRNTISNLEHGKVNPAHSTVLRLLSVREDEEVFALDRLQSLAGSHPQFSYHVLVTDAPTRFCAKQQFAPAWLKERFTDLRNARAVIGGSPGFVQACSDACTALGMAQGAIATDSFTPLAGSGPTTT